MIPAAFKYVAPGTVQHAIELLAMNQDAKVLAGGHSLLPLMKLRLAMPPVLVDINRIPDLDYIREDHQLNRLRIGALVRHNDFEQSPLVKERYPLLWDTAQGIGDPLVRNRGTMAGAVAHADPAADWPAALLALNAEVVATGTPGERVIPITELYVAILTTTLQADELVTEIRVPLPPQRSGGAEADAPLVRPDKEKKSNHIWHWEVGDKAATQKAFDSADVVVAQDIYIPRIHVASIETCGCVASVDPVSGKLTVWMTTQAPHAIRTVFSLVSKIPEHKIRVISPDIGGSFGGKVPVYPGYVCAVVAALTTGKPVKKGPTTSGN